MARANYHVHYLDKDFVYLIDEDKGGMSVTNDAETVVEEVFMKYGNKRIIYRDTELQWDEMVHEHGLFVRFQPIPPDHNIPQP